MEVTLILKGEKLNPDQVTQAFGVQPSDVVYNNNQKQRQNSGGTIIGRNGVWSLSTLNKVTSHVFSEHIDYIKFTLGDAWRKIASIENVESAYIHVLIFVANEEDKSTVEFKITPQNLDDLKHIHLPLQFTIFTVPKA